MRSGAQGGHAVSGLSGWSAADREPKYLRIYADLRDRIAAGRLPAGSLLPSQRELASQFGVSIMTVRQALQLLADDGLMQARHGSGTYVAARYAFDVGHLRSFASDLSAQGASITTEVLAGGTVAPPGDVGARLGVTGDVFRLRRLRRSGGRPVIVQTSYLPAALAHILNEAELGRRGLYTILAEHGLSVAQASETITPATLGPADASDLGRREGTAALLSRQTSFTATGTAIIDDHALMPGDAITITASRSPGRVEMHYALAG
jgi:GntR family transcriptional regulator